MSPPGVSERARWLAGYDANLRRAADWVHVSWHGALAPLVATMHAHAPALRAACSQLLLRTLGHAAPALDGFDAPADRLAALPIEDALRLLRLRALLARHTELRHWIDRASRARLAAWVGADAARALATLPDTPRARADAVPPLAGQSDDTLAWEGWCRFERERAWSPAGPTRAVRFALPRDAACPPWIADAVPAGDGAALLARLLAQHPEWSWLSG